MVLIDLRYVGSRLEVQKLEFMEERDGKLTTKLVEVLEAVEIKSLLEIPIATYELQNKYPKMTVFSFPPGMIPKPEDLEKVTGIKYPACIDFIKESL